MSRWPPQNMILISVFYQLLLLIGDPIWLGWFKLGDEVLDLLVLGAIFIGDYADRYFILDENHEYWLELLMVNLEILFWYWRGWKTKDFTWGLPLQCLYLRCCGGGRQAYLTVETLLEVTSARGWVYEVNRKRVLSGGCNTPLRLWALCYPLLSWFPFCVQLWG